MRLRAWVAIFWLLIGSVATGIVAAPSMFAQSTNTGDRDDDDDDNDDDDKDVPDPDDPGSDVGGGGDDAGGDDAGGGAGSAGDDDGGSDDAGGAGGGGESGGGAAGSGDDDAAGDDDDGPAAGAGGQGSAAGDGDDDDINGDDDGQASASRGARSGGDDDADDDDDRAPARAIAGSSGGDDNDDADDDAGDDGAVEYIGGGQEDEAKRTALDQKEDIETDREGFRYRRGEFVALDLSVKDMAALRTRGFNVLKTVRLASTGGSVHLVKGPPRLADVDAVTALDDAIAGSSIGLNHLFDSSLGEIRKAAVRTAPARAACGCQIGLIDTGVANRLPIFRHVSVEQRAFNASIASPGLHGTAVAYQFAGTAPVRARPTKIVVADIFSGPRASAGSTFALVQALDWLATRGVTVINVSLAGPRNQAVAGAVEQLTRRGHIIVAAAGNDGPAAPPVFPGAYSGVVAVTAVDERQQIYRYANRGNYVDFSALGVSVPAVNAKGELSLATGTSFAAPTVAARLARELGRPEPGASARALAKLEREARDLGAPGRDTVFGHGLLADVR